MAMTRCDVSVVGDINPDIILLRVQGQPGPGRERVVEDALITIGGSSAIFATILARLGLRVRMTGKVGADWFGRYMVEALGREGIDTSGILADVSAKTGITVSITGTEERTLITFPGATGSTGPKDITHPGLYGARHLHVGSFYLQTGLQEAVPRLLREAVERGMTTSLDPGHDPHERWVGLSEVLPWVDLFLANEVEAVHIARSLGQATSVTEADVTAAAAALATRVRQVVAVKRGARGALAYTRGGELVRVAPYPVVVLDTTGAGDAFDAGFVFQYLQGQTLGRCLAFANACGAIACTYLGGASGFPGADRVDEFMRLREEGRARGRA